MSHASNTALDRPAKAGAGPAAISARKARRAEARNASDRAFLDHYFRRLDPEVAASFSAEQRDAIAAMFGARGTVRHAVELRRSVPFPGGWRLYLVLLLGRERRTMSRLYSQGMVSGRFNVAFYLGLGALFLLPVLFLLIAGGR
ncbi:MAG: hypothetical protein IIC53_12735 [Proteobacteria bacterium]|nr:hypothetical protein [Pseudomonadota bacterium]